MAILWSSASNDDAPRLQGKLVYLRAPQIGDYTAWAELREGSRDFLTPWEPVWPADDLTRPAFRARLKRYARDRYEAHAHPFFLFDRKNDALVGGCTLSGIRHSVIQSGVLGYWIGAAHARKGFMTDALRALVPFAFDVLGLHRLEAACLPSNEASQRLLVKAGFSREGLARQYLMINGVWHDHVLFAMLSTDLRP